MGKPIGGENAAKTVARQSSADMVFGHTHTGDVAHHQRLDGETVTAIDVACSLNEGYTAPYAKHARTGWKWRVHVLGIRNGRIKDIEIVSMETLANRYG